LGDILQRVYDEVVKQGVPDRFRNLLQELEQGPEKPHATAGASSSGEQPGDQDTADEDAISDHMAGGKRMADPGSSGAH
jgi:hypothetical protein